MVSGQLDKYIYFCNTAMVEEYLLQKCVIVAAIMLLHLASRASVKCQQIFQHTV